MIYITIPDFMKDTFNQYIRENIDLGGGDTFTVNKQDAEGNLYCAISLPEDDSPYMIKMKEYLPDYTSETPDETLLDLNPSNN